VALCLQDDSWATSLLQLGGYADSAPRFINTLSSYKSSVLSVCYSHPHRRAAGISNRASRLWLPTAEGVGNTRDGSQHQRRVPAPEMGPNTRDGSQHQRWVPTPETGPNTRDGSQHQRRVPTPEMGPNTIDGSQHQRRVPTPETGPSAQASKRRVGDAASEVSQEQELSQSPLGL